MTDSPPRIVLATPSVDNAPPRLTLPAPSGTSLVTPVLRGVPGLPYSGDGSGFVHSTGDETIAGNKTFTDPIDMASHKIVNVADGASSHDAVNKGQLDAAVSATTVVGEVPLRFGTLATLTIGNIFRPGSTAVYRNGLREQLNVGYTESSSHNAITLTTAPLTSDVISVDYIIAT